MRKFVANDANQINKSGVSSTSSVVGPLTGNDIFGAIAVSAFSHGDSGAFLKLGSGPPLDNKLTSIVVSPRWRMPPETGGGAA